MTRQLVCSIVGVDRRTVGSACLKSEPDSRPRGRSFSNAPTSRNFAGTTYATSLARPTPLLCLGLSPGRRPAQHGAGPARPQLGRNVIAICPLGTRPTARGGGQAQREATSCAYPALTVESGIPRRRYPIDIIGGERGTRTLDLGIMSRHLADRSVFST